MIFSVQNHDEYELILIKGFANIFHVNLGTLEFIQTAKTNLVRCAL